MDRQPTIQLIPDWPRIRKLVAEKLHKIEADVQAMADGDSLDRIELTMAIEETIGIRRS
jgi:acyl carrier protein